MTSFDENARERIFEALFCSIADIGEPGAVAMEQARLAHHHCCELEATVGYLLTALMTDDASRRQALEELLWAYGGADAQVSQPPPPTCLPSPRFSVIAGGLA